MQLTLETLTILKDYHLEDDAWITRLLLSSNPYRSYPLNVGFVLALNVYLRCHFEAGMLLS